MRLKRATKYPQESLVTTVNLIEAIQTIKAFVRSAGWPERARDAWKHVREAAFSKAGRDVSDAAPAPALEPNNCSYQLLTVEDEQQQ